MADNVVDFPIAWMVPRRLLTKEMILKFNYREVFEINIKPSSSRLAELRETQVRPNNLAEGAMVAYLVGDHANGEYLFGLAERLAMMTPLGTIKLESLDQDAIGYVYSETSYMGNHARLYVTRPFLFD